ncbi:hypothetical protein AWL63_12515 [Sphingomonas panacis]|uniref:Glycosyltransferase RgtA/B/C/D-like domain-containing protein n=1 Tax=Sphingomonas panacis TaxID=1560345 RepID=A0A1B3ZB68_9SPHN|nr:hypothetical protein [Sphingomonas panacis]AOH84670.1 hypothetical protein AWL63_12515 [Sphingomonas panacis]
MSLTPMRRVAWAAALLCLLQIALWWPGVAMFDTIGQYTQVLSGAYDDWHPPIMAKLWAVLHPLWPGAAPMLLVQAGAYWLGLGLIAAGLARGGRAGAGWAVIALGALPLFVAWQSVVLKDAQMLGAMLAAVGIVARARFGERRLSTRALIAVAVLLGYAALVRTNAVFAVVPLGVMLVPGRRRWAYRAGAIAVLTLAVLAVSPVINHRLFRAEPTRVSHTLPLFDLAGIAHFAGDDGVLSAGERALIAEKHCYQPFFWDPIGSASRCGAIADRFQPMPAGTLDIAWAGAIARHPVAYARHRLAHLNATTRWLVPAIWTSAAPPSVSELNTVGLGSPAKGAWPVVAAAGWLAASPLGWPVTWIVVAASLVVIVLAGARTPVRDLALALAVSALALEASFAVVSIASDLRYHLWPMMAAALAAILVASEGRVPRRLALGCALALALVIAAGLAARATLPSPPPGYMAMLEWDGQAAAPARQPLP